MPATDADIVIVAEGGRVRLRRIEAVDLPQTTQHLYTLSIVEPLTELERAREVLKATAFWTEHAGAVAMEAGGRLVGTLHFYAAGPGIHGYEIGYIVHDVADRGKGYASDALRLFGDLIFAERPGCHRIQLIIETWNDASARLAEACGYQREGVLRKAGYSSTVPQDCWVYSRVR